MPVSKTINTMAGPVVVYIPSTSDDAPGWGDNILDTLTTLIDLANALKLGGPSTTAISAPSTAQSLTSASPFSTLYAPGAAFNATLDSSFTKGLSLRITNTSATYAVTLKANDGSTIYALGQKVAWLIALQDTPTTAAHWAIAYQDLTTSRLDQVVTDVAAMGAIYAADTSITQTLTSTSPDTTFNPTVDHDVILPAAVPLAGWTRKIQNRSATYVLTLKTSGGDTVCKIIPKGWVKFQARTTTPTAGANWMQAEAGGGWADYVPTFDGLGTCTVTSAKCRRNGPNLEVSVLFTCGTPAASLASFTLPFSLEYPHTPATPMVAGPSALATGQTTGSSFVLLTDAGTSYTKIFMGIQNGGAYALVPRDGSGLFSGAVAISASVVVPILGWEIG